MGLSTGTVGDTAYALVAKLNSRARSGTAPTSSPPVATRPRPRSRTGWPSPKDQGRRQGPLALGALDGWTLTDWFENIYIRQAGVEAYDTLFCAEGDLPTRR